MGQTDPKCAFKSHVGPVSRSAWTRGLVGLTGTLGPVSILTQEVKSVIFKLRLPLFFFVNYRFSPTVCLFLFCSVPCLWILEITAYEIRKEIFMSNATICNKTTLPLISLPKLFGWQVSLAGTTMVAPKRHCKRLYYRERLQFGSKNREYSSQYYRKYYIYCVPLGPP